MLTQHTGCLYLKDRHMPDFSLCVNLSCHIKANCRRHTSPASKQQAWAHFEPTNNTQCEFHLPTTAAFHQKQKKPTIPKEATTWQKLPSPTDTSLDLIS
jgi:hypothetical protein